MRIFVAIDIDDAIRARISRFIEGVQAFAPDARWVNPESLHITLKFIGEKGPEVVDKLKAALAGIKSGAVEIHFRGYGFFPTPKSARVFWVGIEAGPPLASLAAVVDDATALLGIEKETRPFSPHLTLARAAGPSGSPRGTKGDRPNRSFQRLQEKLAAMSSREFGTMTAREFFLYQSQLSPRGSKYTKVAAFALR